MFLRKRTMCLLVSFVCSEGGTYGWMITVWIREFLKLLIFNMVENIQLHFLFFLRRPVKIKTKERSLSMQNNLVYVVSCLTLGKY